ncbi:hypothetical protein [Novosphingobium naphthalenivorans]|uniref:hypothetical protein n=1 Tax=Novosphingobium naphthalenivorans TaxID=273168 RepID=UPI00082EE5AF|nr:hypothetical protein [Novosphingobium naphthalenivorans]
MAKVTAVSPKAAAEPSRLTDEQQELMRLARRPRAIAGCLPEGEMPPEGMYLKPGSFDLPPSGWDACQAAVEKAKRGRN